ncbi:MAG: hypoxanthine phosphoribosyltransferase [Clostridia bacterium]|nr:hypoxanthine phosphoribosyltransferase [Clostridia bacterium]
MDIIEKVIISEEEIAGIVKRLASEINKDYEGKKIVLICLLKGSILFLTDLMRKLTVPCKVDFMLASSYKGGTKNTGKLEIKDGLSIDIKGQDVLIVEDILESGHTLEYIVNILNKRKPKSLKICTLLDKPKLRVADIQADYVGKVIPNDFVLGYGLDYDEYYRNLPFVGIINPKYL